MLDGSGWNTMAFGGNPLDDLLLPRQIDRRTLATHTCDWELSSKTLLMMERDQTIAR